MSSLHPRLRQFVTRSITVLAKLWGANRCHATDKLLDQRSSSFLEQTRAACAHCLLRAGRRLVRRRRQGKPQRSFHGLSLTGTVQDQICQDSHSLPSVPGSKCLKLSLVVGLFGEVAIAGGHSQVTISLLRSLRPSPRKINLASV